MWFEHKKATANMESQKVVEIVSSYKQTSNKETHF